MTGVRQVAANIYLIDNHLYGIPNLGGVYLINEEKKALVDTGPATSVEATLDGIRQVCRPQDISYVIATHIHLDHFGGAGMLLHEMPQAQVLAHYRGVRHLVDPSRLVSSLRGVGGEEALRLNGEVAPIPRQRILAMHDNDTLALDEGQTLRFIDAPGHAPHELCIYESRNGGVFVGDAAGLYLEQEKILEPVTPPPNFDLEQYIGTLQKLMILQANVIYFAHFGVSRRVLSDLQWSIDKLRARDGMIKEAMAAGNTADVADKIIAQVREELKPIKTEMLPLYEHWLDFAMPISVEGHIQYLEKQSKMIDR